MARTLRRLPNPPVTPAVGRPRASRSDRGHAQGHVPDPNLRLSPRQSIDVIDRLPLPGGLSATGNIGNGTLDRNTRAVAFTEERDINPRTFVSLKLHKTL